MSRTLFEEAIADARQLREAAEQNAKNAIIEAVTPRIREFIEDQLVGGSSIKENANFLEGALSDEDEEVDEEVNLDESAIKSLVELMSKSGSSKRSNDSDREAIAEAFDSLSEEDQSKLLKMLREEDSPEKGDEDKDEGAYEIDLDELKASVVKQAKSAKAPHGESKMNRHKHELEEDDLYDLDEMMDNLDEADEESDDDDLDEAKIKFEPEDLEGLDDEVKQKLMAMMFSVELPEEEEEGADVEVSDEEPAADDAEAAPEEEAGEPMAEAVYEIDENMLRRELARLREAKSKKKAKSHSNGSHSAAAAAFGGGTLEGDVHDVDLNKHAGMKKALMKEARENRALRQQLNDYRGAVETLREQLSDLNLFNAKLLYVNKILQNKDVAPNQRRAIIEALDGASNLREAKLLYESLSTSISKKNESLNESVRHTAGLASRPVTTSSARMSGAAEVDRWATLAGLK